MNNSILNLSPYNTVIIVLEWKRKNNLNRTSGVS